MIWKNFLENLENFSRKSTKKSKNCDFKYHIIHQNNTSRRNADSTRATNTLFLTAALISFQNVSSPNSPKNVKWLLRSSEKNANTFTKEEVKLKWCIRDIRQKHNQAFADRSFLIPFKMKSSNNTQKKHTASWKKRATGFQL